MVKLFQEQVAVFAGIRSEWSRALEVRTIVEPWAAKEGILTTYENGEFAIAVDIAIGEDKDQVVRSVVNRLKEIAVVLSGLKQKQAGLDNA